jgi:hypothetical protein
MCTASKGCLRNPANIIYHPLLFSLTFRSRYSQLKQPLAPTRLRLLLSRPCSSHATSSLRSFRETRLNRLPRETYPAICYSFAQMGRYRGSLRSSRKRRLQKEGRLAKYSVLRQTGGPGSARVFSGSTHVALTNGTFVSSRK